MTPEFISIPEWARRIGVSKDSAYKAARAWAGFPAVWRSAVSIESTGQPSLSAAALLEASRSPRKSAASWSRPSTTWA